MAVIFFLSLGCDKNRVDAEMMASRLSAAGHAVTDDADSADIAVVNTCAFIQSAKEEAIEAVFDMVRKKEEGALKAVIVSGCMAERYAEEILKEIPEVDAVVGLSGNADICEAVEKLTGGSRLFGQGSPLTMPLSGKRLLSTPPHIAYLRIAEGCDNRCAFCAIPLIRGPYRSRPLREIGEEARDLVSGGVRELVLIAQDTTSYGRDLADKTSLADVLRDLSEISGIWKIRILYAYPDRLSREMIGAMAASEKIARYLDIPLQHADPAVLRRMRRMSDTGRIRSLIGSLRTAMPDISIRSSFICGFPGETEQQFQALLDFLRETRLERAGCFAFSGEEGTDAYTMPNQIDEPEKQRRVEQFYLVQSAILEEKQRQMQGKTLEVICDGYDEEDDAFSCRSQYDAPDIDTRVLLPAQSDLMPGEIYRVKICSTDGVDLAGELET